MNIEKAQAARNARALEKLVRVNGVVISWGDWLASLDRATIETSESDRMIDWSRNKFNRMNHREQAEYEARLKAGRYFWVNNWCVPKAVYDAAIAMKGGAA